MTAAHLDPHTLASAAARDGPHEGHQTNPSRTRPSAVRIQTLDEQVRVASTRGQSWGWGVGWAEKEP